MLDTISPASHPGLLGICLSGAGPTILALATDNFAVIAEDIIKNLTSAETTGSTVHCEWKLLQPAEDGATVIGSLNES